ncbi:MAG: type II toxin-antitoxin system RelE/ParE family toxin [Nitrospinota bacterium]
MSEEAQKRIIQYLRERIAKSQDPKKWGKPLRGEKTGLWRYQLGKYRIICLIEKNF